MLDYWNLIENFGSLIHSSSFDWPLSFSEILLEKSSVAMPYIRERKKDELWEFFSDQTSLRNGNFWGLCCYYVMLLFGFDYVPWNYCEPIHALDLMTLFPTICTSIYSLLLTGRVNPTKYKEPNKKGFFSCLNPNACFEKRKSCWFYGHKFTF